MCQIALSKSTKKKKKKTCCVIFWWRGCVVFLTTVTTVTAVTSFFFYFLSTFGKSNLTHLTNNVMFSGQRFAILTVFFVRRGCMIFSCPQEVAWFCCCPERLPDLFVSREVLWFSPNRPTGPIRSSSCNVRPHLVSCPLPMRFSQGSKGGPSGAKLSPTVASVPWKNLHPSS